MRVIVRWVSAVAVLTGLAACGGIRPVAEEPLGRQETAQPRTATTGTPKVRSGWTSCAVDAPMEFSVPPPEALTAPRLGIDFAAATAVHCQLETRSAPTAARTWSSPRGGPPT
ncbi:hypothetical protein GCM10027614_81920 [Micromonospora vulcania]